MRLKFLPPILLFALLSACSLVGGANSSPTPDAASMTRVAEAVAGTQAAQARQTESVPVPTDTPDRAPLTDSLVNGGNMNRVQSIWPLEPREATIPSANPLCLRTCAQELWVSTDGYSTLQVSLFEFASKDQVIDQLDEIRSTQEVVGVQELPMPDLVELPPESWIQDNGGTGSRYTLHTLQGRVLLVLTIYLAGEPLETNTSLLTLYANEQIELLKFSGW